MHNHSNEGMRRNKQKPTPRLFSALPRLFFLLSASLFSCFPSFVCHAFICHSSCILVFRFSIYSNGVHVRHRSSVTFAWRNRWMCQGFICTMISACVTAYYFRLWWAQKGQRVRCFLWIAAVFVLTLFPKHTHTQTWIQNAAITIIIMRNGSPSVMPAPH